MSNVSIRRSHKICSAVAVFTGPKIRGSVTFTDDGSGEIVIDIDLSGLKKTGVHGFHIHEYGDLSQGCDGVCDHFNPYKTQHGGPEDKERHVGDLGNIYSDDVGRAYYRISDTEIKLRGTKCNVIGRGLVIHADPDDLGKGSNTASRINGNAGKRIACAVIGWRKP